MLAGGTESMSQAPHVVRGARWGLPLGKGGLDDSLMQALFDTYTSTPMGMTAENLAEQYKLTQDEVDGFSLLSQQRYQAAHEGGRFTAEIAPVEIKTKKGVTQFLKDEHPRPESSLEGYKKLPKVFKKDGVVHPGAASGINDGAASALLSTRAFAEKKGIKPIGRLVNWAAVGCDPRIMGIGPAPAIRKLMERAEFKLSDIDLFEVNEAFAPAVPGGGEGAGPAARSHQRGRRRHRPGSPAGGFGRAHHASPVVRAQASRREVRRRQRVYWRRAGHRSSRGGHVTNVPDAKALRDRAKQLAEERRTERKNRKRKCSLCGTEESEKTPFVAHPDGIGPSCKEPSLCENYRAKAAGLR